MQLRVMTWINQELRMDVRSITFLIECPCYYIYGHDIGYHFRLPMYIYKIQGTECCNPRFHHLLIPLLAPFNVLGPQNSNVS